MDTYFSKIKKNPHQQGFTLIEAMVAIAIFTIVMVIGISSLLNVNSVNKKSQNLRSIIDNLNYTMEDMSRNFKLGSYYHCVTGTDPAIVFGQANDFLVTPNDCGTTGHTGAMEVALEPMSGIPFDQTTATAHAEDQVVYWFDPADNCTLKKSIDGGANFVAITSSDIHIDCTTSGFNVFNTIPGTYAAAPRVTIRISGKVIYKNVETPFSLQTTATQRNIDVVMP